MPDPAAGRRAELIAAAVSGELTPRERAEFDGLRAADPSVDVEVRELRAVLGSLDGLDWNDSAPDAVLRDRVLALDETAVSAPVRTLAPRRRWLVGLGAAACLVAGAGLGIGGAALLAPERGPQPGEPGVLGALEHVDFAGEPAGVVIDGSLVAHTWGTETILEIDGLPVGDSYTVVLVDSDGEAFDSGTFLGASVTIDCRMNAAVDRPDVDSVEIRDAGGAVVASADLPAVGS
jgi:anti-sigma factor RsiW